jgi:hypothetical protein
MSGDFETAVRFADELGIVKGRQAEMMKGMDEIKKSVSDLDARLTAQIKEGNEKSAHQLEEHSKRSAENFDNITASIQDLKDVITGQKAGAIVWRQVRGGVWAVVVLACTGFASVFTGAWSWFQHFFN